LSESISFEGDRAMSASLNPATVISAFLGLYSTILLIRVLLTWLPSINWYDQPWETLAQLTDPYLNIFRSIIPPLGGFDISSMLAIFALQFAQSFVSAQASALQQAMF
jgi:YggT family protein